MSTIKDAVKAVADKMRSLSSIASAPADPPGTLSRFPTAVTFYGGTTWVGGGNQYAKGLHTIVTQVHISQKDLARDVDTLNTLAQTVPLAFLNDVTLGGVVDTINEVRCGGIQDLTWGSKETLGLVFEIDLKIRVDPSS